MVFVPSLAPFVVMAFVLTALSLALSLLGFVGGLIARNRMIARVALLAGLVVAGGYGAAWVVGGLAGRDRTLSPGERKYFCEIDCHLAYSVTEVRTARTLGHGASAAAADGMFTVVTLETWFDPRTISRHRPLDAPLTPNPRRVAVVDAEGRSYLPSPEGQRALDLPSTPLTTPLIPGQSYRTLLVFDLPAGVRAPRLLLTDPDPLLALLIGHEDGPLHGKAYFALPPVPGAS